MIPDRSGHKPSAVTSPRGTARSRRTEVPLFRGDDPARRGMMRIRLPGRPIVIGGLIAPGRPALARAAREQLEIGPRTARLDDPVLLVRLARMLALARRQQVHLPPPRRQRARVLAAYAEQDELG